MTALASATRPNFDVEAIRADFPILHQQINGHDLVFLDTAASAQKPRQVIQAMVDVMENDYANVHRGVYALSQRATDKFEAARGKAAKFINAPHEDSIIFSRGATEGINLVAASYGQRLGAGDEIITTELEHHSNIVPWQIIAEKQGAKVLFAPMDDNGALDMDALRSLISNRTQIVAVTHVANTMGTVLPVQEIARLAHAVGAVILVDGCQAAPHMPVDVQALDVDFYAFSGHKIYGPTGIGALYGRPEILADMPPYQGGGEMIETVEKTGSTYKEPPLRFEAGTPAIVEAVGFGAAIDYIQSIGLEGIGAHETDVAAHAEALLRAMPEVEIMGKPGAKASVLSFNVKGAHAHDVGTILDQMGVAVRAGQHCAQPVMDRFGVHATARASFGMYNTKAEAEALATAVAKTIEIFG
jgi:cysteine desulfurase / selenocysteine lyase